MEILSTSQFREELHKLLKSANKYGACKVDICQKLNGKSFEEIYQIGQPIRLFGRTRIIKLRIQNSLKSGGSRGAYRLLYSANPDTQKVILLHIFPKTGPEGTDNVPSEFLKRLLKTAFQEKENGSLVAHDITQELMPIVS